MRKLKIMLIALLCAVTTVVSFGVVKSITAKADETSDYVYADTSVISVTANADLPGYPRLELTGVDYKVKDAEKRTGKFTRLPERSELNQEINEQLIVEYYNRLG